MKALATSVQHTSYDPVKLQLIVNTWWSKTGRQGTPQSVTTYNDFAAAIPLMTKEDYVKTSWALWDAKGSERFFIGGSSATTGNPKLILTRVPPKDSAPNEMDRALVRLLRTERFIRDGDVVANLFGVVHFSLLHHAMCRIAEPCRANVVPVGSLEQGSQAKGQLDFLAALCVNVLVGTPSSIVQIAHAAQLCSVELPIDRILFTGEAMGAAKQTFVKKSFPKAKILGLYGLSECGFIGIGENDSYSVRDDAYFLELDNEGRLFVSVLDPDEIIPILRYPTGDTAMLFTSDRGFHLKNLRRGGIDFNFMGNLIEFRKIQDVVGRTLGCETEELQLTLSTDVQGRDLLKVCILGGVEQKSHLMRIKHAICEIPEVREALEKNAGDVSIELREITSSSKTSRFKQSLVIDLRK